MTTVAPPNPSLVAIILVIQARSGPRLVYHYPPSPSPRVASNLSEDRLPSYAKSSDSDDQTTSTSDEDVSSNGYAKGNTKSKRANITDEEDEDSSTPGADEQRHGGWRVPWEHLLGLDAGALERLLMPSDRSWHKRRFEVGFNELVFVGWPVFIREDGSWRKKRRKGKGSGNKAKAATVDEGIENWPKAEVNAQEELEHLEQADIVPSASTESREMTVFNVVFVLNPPILEYSLRVKEMYDHVVKKLARALKWEQDRANYVWQQSEIILKAKAEARHKSWFPISSEPLGDLISI
jgi:nitrogen permease regulator 3-like protein